MAHAIGGGEYSRYERAFVDDGVATLGEEETVDGRRDIGKDIASESRDDLAEEVALSHPRGVWRGIDDHARGRGVDHGDIAVGRYERLVDVDGSVALPNAHFREQVEKSSHETIAILLRDSHADAHLDDERWGADGVEGVCDGGLENRCCLVDPDEIEIEETCVGDETLCGHAAYAGLRHLVEEDIGGVDVDDHIGAREILDDLMGDMLDHVAIVGAWEDAVHVEIESGDATADGIDAEGVYGGPNLDSAEDIRGLGSEAARHLETDILTFELIAMDASDDADAGAVTIADDELIYLEFFGDGELFGNDSFD